MQKHLTFITLIFLVCFFSSCKKGDSINNSLAGVNINIADSIITSVQGLIVDENNNPKSGVTIKAGNKSIVTDTRGNFQINDVTLNRFASLITAEAVGYFKSYRCFLSKAGNIEFVRVKLVPRLLSGSINAIAGGSITLSDNTIVTLPAAGFITKSNGVAYNGAVKVFAHPFNPTNADISQTIPGSLMAIDSSNERVNLISYGMVAVELEGSSGEQLQLATGKTANIKQPIPPSIFSAAPLAIPMWYLDEKTGLWKQEGVAIKNGINYVSDVSHFTYWNFDAATPGVLLEMTILDSIGHPLPNTLIQLSSGGGLSNYGYTDSRGYVALMFGRNLNATLQIINDNCHSVVYAKSLGAFGQSTNIGNINVTTGNNGLYVGGIAKDCNNIPINQGNVLLYFEGKYFNTSISAGGNFGITLPTCHISTSLEIYAVDNLNHTQGNVRIVNLLMESAATLQLSGCGSVTSASGTVYIGCRNYNTGNHYMYAIDAINGTIKWSKYLVGGATTTCAFAKGKLYFSGTEQLMSIDTITHDSKNLVSGSAIKGTPLYYNNAIYFSDNYKTRAVDVNTENIILNVNTGGGLQVNSGYTVSNGILYRGNLLSLNLSNSALNTSIPDYIDSYSSPAISNGTVYSGCNASLLFRAYNASTLATKWTYKMDSNVTFNGLYMESSPTVSNGIVYFSAKTDVGGRAVGMVYAVNANTGTLIWKKQIEGVPSASSPIVANNTLYIGGKYLYAFDAASGNQKWGANVPLNFTNSSPVYANGVVYIGGGDGILYSVDANTGVINWTVTLGSSNGFEYVSPIVVDKNGNVYHPGPSGEQN